MIWLLLLKIPVLLLNVLTMVIPRVTELPFLLDDIVTEGFGHFFFIMAIIPPLQVMFNAYMAVITFKIAVKFFAMIPWLRSLLHK